MSNRPGLWLQARSMRPGAVRASIIGSLALVLAAPLGVAWAQPPDGHGHDARGGSGHVGAPAHPAVQSPRGGGAASPRSGGAPNGGHFTAAPRFHAPGRAGESAPAQSFHQAPQSRATVGGARGFRVPSPRGGGVNGYVGNLPRDSRGSERVASSGREADRPGGFDDHRGFERGSGYARIEEHHYDRDDWQRHRHWDGGYWNGRYWPAIHDRADFVWLLPALPASYVTYWWDGVPYYYYDDTYYTWDPADDGYVATEPPPVAGGDPNAAEAQFGPGSADASASAQLYAYPTQGQSPAQQAQDRQDCQQWASSQAPTDADTYQRALKACFKGRGYSVD